MAGTGKRGPRKGRVQGEKPTEKKHGNSKLSEEKITLISSMLKTLIPLETAARAVGISRQTLYNWKQQGKRDKADGKDTLHAKFFDVVDEAEAQGEAMAVQSVYNAGPQYVLSLLRSRFPARWAETQRLQVELEQMQGEMLDALKEGLSPEEYRKVIAVMRAYGGE